MRAWLMTLAVMVFLDLSLGGATRLTGSGLSITEWQPIVGVLPPLNEADWRQAFAKYQEIPQYQRINSGMHLDAFKVIFWWEWAHRLLGRLIGAAALLPLLYFLAARQIAPRLLVKLAFLVLLGALEGAVGWYMVNSGLADRVDVSQYRLALHLALALAIFGVLIATARGGSEAGSARRGSGSAAVIVALVFLQSVLGALVAGLKAGLSHNTWPLMDGRIVPAGLGIMEPWYKNMFENAMTVQFDHRLAAYALLLATLWHAWRMAPSGEVRIRPGALLLAAAALAQTSLGVLTLLAHVPLPLALAHQSGAAAVFGLAVWHLHSVRHAG